MSFYYEWWRHKKGNWSRGKGSKYLILVIVNSGGTCVRHNAVLCRSISFQTNCPEHAATLILHPAWGTCLCRAAGGPRGLPLSTARMFHCHPAPQLPALDLCKHICGVWAVSPAGARAQQELRARELLQGESCLCPNWSPRSGKSNVQMLFLVFHNGSFTIQFFFLLKK